VDAKFAYDVPPALIDSLDADAELRRGSLVSESVGG
jgi:hypothetical protein